MSSKNLIIAFGGESPEHEVSVLTAIQAASVLNETSYNLVPLYITKSGRWLTGKHLFDLNEYENLKSAEEKSTPCIFAKTNTGQTVLTENNEGILARNKKYTVDTVLTAFHGSYGENGAFQGVFEAFNIPYTGSGIKASSIGMDKVTAKALCESAGVQVVEGVDFYETEWAKSQDRWLKRIEALSYPVVVKPTNLGSSIGVTVAADQKNLIRAIETAFRYDEHLLVEKAVSPLIEINCSVTGTPEDCRSSVCERPLGKQELLTFKDKYQADEGGKGMASAERIIPADITDELSEKIRDTSQKVYSLFGCSGVARLDFLINSDTNQIYFNEINTIPGSFSFYLWKESGTGFKTLLLDMITIAKEQHRRKNGRIQTYETNLLSQKAVKGLKGLKGSK